MGLVSLAIGVAQEGDTTLGKETKSGFRLSGLPEDFTNCCSM